MKVDSSNQQQQRQILLTDECNSVPIDPQDKHK